MSGFSKNIKLTLLALFLAVCPLILSCSEPSSPFGQIEITLSALDASCTEVWLDLKFLNLTQPADVTIQKDGVDHKFLLGLNRDTLLYFQDLNPSQTYAFRAIIRHEGKNDRISNTVSVKMMDTTSHNFTWQTWTFGAGGASAIFYDGHIFDENNIWVTGYFYHNGQPHNVIRWNGEEWQPKRVLYSSSQGSSFSEILSMLAIAPQDIFFSNGTYWDGEIFRSIPPVTINFNGIIKTIWGKSTNNFYMAGAYGNLAQFKDGTWVKLNSGVDVEIHDLYGVTGTDDKTIIYGAASNKLSTEAKKIFRIYENNQLNYMEWPESLDVTSVWGPSERKLYAAGSGVHEYNGSWKLISEIDYIYSEAVRGESYNNIFAAGHFGLLSHFNGVNWKNLREFASNVLFQRIDVKGDLVLLTGSSGGLGFIALGRMQ